MGTLRRIALVALFAIASAAFLPLAHGATGHAGDCGVCIALTHGGARVADVGAAAVAAAPRECPSAEAPTATPLPTRPALDSCCARAPPSVSVAA
jgi:hypothetical protein